MFGLTTELITIKKGKLATNSSANVLSVSPSSERILTVKRFEC